MPLIRALSLALALSVAAALAAPAFAKCSQPAQTKALIEQINNQINAYRRMAGLAALYMNGALMTTAQDHACDMAAMGKHSHSGSNGSDLSRRLKTAGYRFRAANENVGRFGKSNAAEWWYNSSGHRANILSPAIKEVGFGVALGADQQQYWVMVGGAQK